MLKRTILLVLVVMLATVLVIAAVEQKAKDETVKCPVSSKEIKKSEAKASCEYEGKTYYFCCDKCKEVFVKDPGKYVKKMGHAEHATHAHEGMIVDPVCGMEFKKEKAKATHEYNGKTYYFCCPGCKEKFEEDSEKYSKEKE